MIILDPPVVRADGGKEAAGRMIGSVLASNQRANQTWPQGMDLRGSLLHKRRRGNTMDGESDAEPKRPKMGDGESTKKGGGGGNSSNVYNFYNCSNLSNMTFN